MRPFILLLTLAFTATLSAAAPARAGCYMRWVAAWLRNSMTGAKDW